MEIKNYTFTFNHWATNELKTLVIAAFNQTQAWQEFKRKLGNRQLKHSRFGNFNMKKIKN